MRVLVCGGRDFDDTRLFHAAMNQLHRGNRFTALIHGDAKGADRLADAWARQVLLPVLRFPADWNLHGRTAGAIRNQQMLVDGRPSLVVAFPGGKGTADMVKRARAAGIIVEEPAMWNMPCTS
jgi:hypothetical protein